MKLTLPIVFLLLCMGILNPLESDAQVLSPRDSLYQYYFDPIRSSYNCTVTPGQPYKAISEDALRTMIRRDFSFLVLNRDQAAATAGTGLTFDLNSDKSIATYNIAFMNGAERRRSNNAEPMPPGRWILSAAVTAGYSNSIGNLFGNTKANPKAGITGKFSYIICSGPSNDPAYCNTIVPATQQFIDVLKTTGQIEMVKYSNLGTSLAAKQADLSRFNTTIQNLVSPAAATLAPLLDSVKKTEEAILSIRQQMAANPPHAKKLYARLNDSLVAYELKNVQWSRQTIIWVDATVGYNVGNYNLFDDVSTFKNNDTSFSQKSFGIALQGLTNCKKQLVYWKIGYRNASASNLDNATAYTLDQSAIYSNGAVQQKIGKSVSAYRLSETKAFERYRQHIVEGDAIYMFMGNTLGVHAFGDLGFNYDTQLYTKTGVLNGGLGLIFTVYDQAKDKAKLNIEPFVKLKDINTQTPLSEKYATWERFSFGIKLGLPFNRILL